MTLLTLLPAGLTAGPTSVPAPAAPSAVSAKPSPPVPAAAHPSPPKAAPPSPPAAPKAVAPPIPPTHTPPPDYGGRDAPVVPTDIAGSGVPNPLAQAGRALEALVIVLAGIVGVLFLIKRAGLFGHGPVASASGIGGGFWKKQATQATANLGSSASLAIVQSQPLPGGATLHLLAVNDKALLLIAATPQNVTLLAEWDQEALAPSPDDARAEDAAFADYLRRTGIAPETTSSRAAGERVVVTADRLQSLLARSRAGDLEEKS